MERLISRSAVVLLAIWLVGCATILYPERRGQSCGRYLIDVTPALLDAGLLLFGVMPGAVAFGVDATSGSLWECADARAMRGCVEDCTDKCK